MWFHGTMRSLPLVFAGHVQQSSLRQCFRKPVEKPVRASFVQGDDNDLGLASPVAKKGECKVTHGKLNLTESRAY